MANPKLILKDATNFWLSYLLAQPVDFDVMIVAYFLLEYSGFFLWYESSRSLLSWVQTPLHVVARKLQRVSVNV